MILAQRARTGPRIGISIPRVTRLLAVAALALPAAYALPSVHAQTIRYVNGTTGTNSGSCTLAAPCKTITFAIGVAASGDTINIAAGTYNELVTIPALTTLTLLGAGTATVPPSAPTTIINGTGLGCSVVTVPKGSVLTLNLITITGGSGTVGTCPVSPTLAVPTNIEGGGIFVALGGTLTLQNSLVTGNTTASTNPNAAEGDGGGIYNAGTLTVSSSTISGNTAGSGPSTAASGVHVPSGGGIFNDATGILSVDSSTISGNSVSGDTALPGDGALGGGIGSSSAAGTATVGTVAGIPALSITNSTINANTATQPAGALQRAVGGGVWDGDFSGLTGVAADVIANSTITGNTATTATVAAGAANGGGISNETINTSTLSLINDTITSNTVADTGAGAVAADAVGGGINAPGVVGNTIFASNASVVGTAPGTSTSSDCGALIVTDNGGNLADDATCTGTATAGLAASIGALANNGGETMTQALLTGSPAIGAGVNATCLAAPINDLDQRGLPRYSILAPNCDSGAYDTGGGVVPPMTVTGSIPLTTGVPARLGFAASNTSSFAGAATMPAGATLPSFNIGYITFQLGASTFTVRQPVSIACTSAIVGTNHCLGTTGVVQGVTQFISVPGTATITLSGFISSARGAYAQGSTATVTLSATSSATGKITVSAVKVSVTPVGGATTTVATWSTLPAGTSIQFAGMTTTPPAVIL